MPQASVGIEFKAIKPEKWKTAGFRLEMLNALDKLSRALRRDFLKTVATWTRKPKFTIGKSFARTTRTAGIVVGTDNPIWGILNFGRGPQLIVPHRSKALAIRDRRAKTRLNSFSSTAGGKFGQVRYRAWAQTRGIRPRRWTELAQSKYPRLLEKAVTNSIIVARQKGMK